MPNFLEAYLQKYVAEIRKIYGEALKEVVLYGSYARGDFNADSDVDIMILLNMSDIELKKYSKELSYMTYDFNEESSLDIKPIAKDIEHFNKWKQNYPFYANIASEGVVLYGVA